MTISVATLRTIPLFDAMTDRSLEAVLGLGHEASYAAGEVIMREGDEGDRFVLFLDGRADVLQGDTPIGSMATGSFAGEVALIDGRPRTATVRAATPVRALAIERDEFLSLLDDHPSVRLELLMALTQRLRANGLAEG